MHTAQQVLNAFLEGSVSTLIEYIEFMHPDWSKLQIAEQIIRFDSRLEYCQRRREDIEHYLAYYLGDYRQENKQKGAKLSQK